MMVGRRARFRSPTRHHDARIRVDGEGRFSRGPIPLIGGWGATNSCVTITRWTPIERTYLWIDANSSSVPCPLWDSQL